MHEIICPNCNKAFTVDEAGYSAILMQVKNTEFEKELNLRLKKEKEYISGESENKRKLEIQDIQNKKDSEINDLKLEIENLKSQIQNSDSEHKLLLEKQSASDRENYSKELEKIKSDISKKDTEIATLKEKINASDSNYQMRLQNELNDKNNQIETLKYEIKTNKVESELALSNKLSEMQNKLDTTKASYEATIKEKDVQIEYYKDLKTRMSTKMVGETLEQHCMTQFNQLRMTGFKHAYFDKDNDARTGSKGDFIFRDYDDDGTEFISIMFEMKNELDNTVTKHKNKDFFKELDKDRREKNCEYAVLVSMLEADNEFYNNGIVDISYEYPKMYVVRPQFFIPIITLLRNAAFNSLDYKRQLEEMKRENIDITNFESKLDDFKDKFSYNYEQASKRFNEAIDSIDKSIKQLEMVKEKLLASDRQLRLASDKVEDVNIKKLTKDNPTMRKKFEELNN